MSKQHHSCQCACRETQFSVRGFPLMRAYCHCTICQEFNQSAYADICIYRAQDVLLPMEGQVEFKAHRPPPAVQRGQCVHCEKPALELMQIFPLPKLVIVPTQNMPAACVVEPSLHVFYNSRVQDMPDDLPRFEGYWRSQLGFGKALVKAMLRRGSAG